MNNINGVLWAAPIADIFGLAVAIALITHYFRHLGRTIEVKNSAATIQNSRPGVIIIIAREHGSQGKKIGELVAKQLGVPYYYKELTALAAQEGGLDKQIYAPKSFRIENIQQMYNDDDKTAKKNLERADRNRAQYYEMISGRKWGAAENYDLCINAALGKTEAATTIVNLAKNKS